MRAHLLTPFLLDGARGGETPGEREKRRLYVDNGREYREIRRHDRVRFQDSSIATPGARDDIILPGGRASDNNLAPCLSAIEYYIHNLSATGTLVQ